MLKTLFPSAYFTKGEKYYQENRVHHLKIEPGYNKQSDRITAAVSGSRKTPYDVTVTIRGNIHKMYLHGTCSCPIGVNCKHVVATLLQAMNDLEAKTVISPDIPDDSFTYPAPAGTQPVDNYHYTPQWAPNPRHGSYNLHYVFHQYQNATPSVELSLLLVRTSTAGGSATPMAYRLTNPSHQQYLTPTDHDLIAQLTATCLQDGLRFFTILLKGPALENLLPAIIATGRCHWTSVETPPLSLSPPQKTSFEWVFDESGCQQLKVKLPANYLVLNIDRLWYLNKTTHEIGLINTGLSNEATQALLSTPKISPQSTQFIVNLFDQDASLAAVPRPIVLNTHEIKTIKPTPCLHISQQPFTPPVDPKKNLPSVETKQPVLTLTFQYEKATIPWHDKQQTLNHLAKDTLIQYPRNTRFEKDIIEELAKHDVLPAQRVFKHLAANQAFGQYFLIGPTTHNPIDFSAHTVPLLRAQGWHIEFAADYPYQVIDHPIDEWYSSIQESTEHDWFTLELGIFLNGEKINLLPILHNLIKKLQANDDTFDPTRTEPVLAELEDGRFIALPAERVATILNILVEIYGSEHTSRLDYLTLSKLHAARLLELEAALGAVKLRWHGGERLRQLAAKLTHFKGIKPVQLPHTFHGELRPYQQEGLNWLQFLREYELGGILADDMGLGKTVQALSHLLTEKCSGRMQHPCLIVAPTSLMYNWRMEAERFAPDLKCLVLHGAQRKQYFNDIAQYDLVLTTYPLLKYDKAVLLKQRFHLLILDEAQCIKNAKSLSTLIAVQIQSNYRLCLTGTPLENHLSELWSLFHFLMPGLLGELKEFNRLFRFPIEKQGNRDRHEHLKRRLAPFLLRRTKTLVAKELPEKVNMIQSIEIHGAQRDLYETIRITMQKKIKQEIAKLGFARGHLFILDALLKLRQICCDPRLLKVALPNKSKAKSAKLEWLMTLLPELLEEGRRILVFSQFTEMLALIEQELMNHRIRYVKLTGQTRNRSAAIKQFQQGEVSLFLISLKAGGTGLNLTAADTVIHYDPWWNPAVEDQATDRAHRIGQDKTVFVYKLVTKGTIEERILEMQKNKRALMEALFTGEKGGNTFITESDLQHLFAPLDPAGK